MRAIANVSVGVGLLAVVNGVVAYFLRYNFITQERYGFSLVPLYILGGGIGVLLLGAVFKTIADTQQTRRQKDAGQPPPGGQGE